ncbi:DinB family protein [Saccharopolyspora sp. NPDC047091]|uniref:DinB family protein n=1 Tax=Saccharopolyspora sp. NPDC047091 TaxID=3155924 RepID=UPI00340ABDBD
MTDHKDDLHQYLRDARDALLWKLDGLSEQDVRRPLTPTGTNLLGLLKHVASVAVGYFGEVYDRPFPEPMPWIEDGGERNEDMYATAEESREQIIGFWHRAWAHADATIAALPLDAAGRVPWWPPERGEIILHRLLCHMLEETARHTGHADVVRELIDGAAGRRATGSNLPEQDERWWADYREHLEEIARTAG